MNTSRSESLFEKSRQLIPGGVNSPVRAFRHVGRSPIFFEKAAGCFLWDADGNRYVDFCLGFGPHLFGHSFPPVVTAIQEQATKATTLGACHPGEVAFAEKLLRAFPFADRVRLVNSGTEAVMTAARIARGVTGRNLVVMFEGCYHGHSDSFLAKAGSGVAELVEATSKGVPSSVVADTRVVRWGDWTAIEKLFAEEGTNIAAVLLEPIPANHGLFVPPKQDIQRFVALARSSGALVIFDEVISGFRVGPSGAAGYFDMQPDLVTCGKIIGGGLPLAAVLGKNACLEALAPMGSVYQAGTLSGNPLAVAAGIAVLDNIQKNPPYESLAKATQWFAQEIEKILNEKTRTRVLSFASMFWIHFGTESGFPTAITHDAAKTYASFFNSLLSQGVYLPPSPYEVCFLSAAHTREVLEDTLEKVRGVDFS